MRRLLFLIPLLAASCGTVATFTLGNLLQVDRLGETVEIPLDSLPGFVPGKTVLQSPWERTVPYQITHDRKLVFLTYLRAGRSETYKLRTGRPVEGVTLACGSHRPDRLDDIIWENDLSGYRIYGPAFKKAGHKGYGYDVFTKSTPLPVMTDRFDKALYGHPKLSFHEDHGDGMDAFGVGPTLGCGGSALMDGWDPIAPNGWASHEILDNGPFRFTLRVTFSPFEFQGRQVTETRLVSISAGDLLNKVTLSYEGLDASATFGAGIVIHPENAEPNKAWRVFLAHGTVISADLGDHNFGKNGYIYCGIYMPGEPAYAGFVPYDEAAQKKHGGARGHLLLLKNLAPGQSTSYWFGSGWSKAGIESLDDWEALVEDWRARQEAPITYTIKR